MPKVTCEECGGQFYPLKTKQADMIRRCAKGKWTELGIECPRCKDYTMINPTAVVAGEDGTAVSTPTYRCPVSACAGFVSFVKQKTGDFWGCGECGSIWYDSKKLLKEIGAIVKQYPYRKKCYRKSKGQWVPSNLDKHPEDYEELVGEEPADEAEDYVRG